MYSLFPYQQGQIQELKRGAKIKYTPAKCAQNFYPWCNLAILCNKGLEAPKNGKGCNW